MNDTAHIVPNKKVVVLQTGNRLFEVDMWIGHAHNGTLDHLTRIMPANNEWEAIGHVILQLRTTHPHIEIRPDGISVKRK